MLTNTGERQIGTTLEQISPDHLNRYEFAAEWIRVNFAKANVLDAACGIGYGSYLMGRMGAHVIGVDISEEAVANAKEHYSSDNVTYEIADLQGADFPFEDSLFDCSVSFETIEHLEDPAIYLKRLASCSKFIIASVPNEDVLHYNGYHFPFHFRHYTPVEFEDLMRECGFSVQDKYTQTDKRPGIVVEGFNGRNLIVVAKSNFV